jgi:hypothetical protein
MSDLKPKLRKIGRLTAAIVAVCLFGFFGLKGCVVTTWTPPTQPASYRIIGEDDRSMTFTFLPDRRALITYDDPRSSSSESMLVRVKYAVYGTHYAGPLWNVSNGAESLLGFRWISGGAEPARFTYEVVNKHRIGFGDSTFPAVGTTTTSLFHFRDGAFKFADMWLKSVPYHESEVQPMVNALQTK